ncbi:hypothetical protein HYY69_03570 [Candidatus Woesearchaeota archaeon]|nr:hypothetical protein [Candidatus Woesearchaeota archaeon]
MKSIIKRILIILIILSIQSLMIISVSGYQPDYYFTVTMHKGWNLLPEGSLDYAKLDEKQVSKEVMTILSTNANFGEGRYLYVPPMKQYLVLGGKDDKNAMGKVYGYVDQGYLHFTPSWTYYKKDTVLSLPYYTASIDKFPKEFKLKLHQGWNFLTVMPQFNKGELTDADCEIIRTYAWNPKFQQWTTVNWDEEIMDDDDYMGYGVAVKVKNTCQLRRSYTASNAPPALPDEESKTYSGASIQGPRVYETNIGNIKFMKKEVLPKSFLDDELKGAEKGVAATYKHDTFENTVIVASYPSKGKAWEETTEAYGNAPKEKHGSYLVYNTQNGEFRVWHSGPYLVIIGKDYNPIPDALVAQYLKMYPSDVQEG